MFVIIVKFFVLIVRLPKTCHNTSTLSTRLSLLLAEFSYMPQAAPTLANQKRVTKGDRHACTTVLQIVAQLRIQQTPILQDKLNQRRRSWGGGEGARAPPILVVGGPYYWKGP